VAAIDVALAHPPPEEPSPHCALRKEHHVVDEDVLDPSLDLSNGQASSATLAGICSEASSVGSSWLRPADVAPPQDDEDVEEWFEVPITPLSSSHQSLASDAFIQACTAQLPSAILPSRPSIPLPVVPRHSGRIAKFAGKEIPGTLSWAQKTIICQLGLAERPEHIDDGTLTRYKSFFANELLEHQILALRELFSKDTPRDVDVAAHSALLEAAC
jgi:hypothetical protein